ncbi:hypothetical protein PPERSA_03319 [Pseudocohnilembus persalinus]|uniref:chitin synthase n=1 Tax=Pseudocohnilembus persalinus TaxID=266149 RepID=A0A0V0Q8A3_PSEPJ|nr:hypothetical protein PPERSA_03319 [Pseudocohnilembus persalinus]|eukprot:KRW98488.1 hypothetical protein PPERSA_03319 [Pseudocohnilembus persalinus]
MQFSTTKLSLKEKEIIQQRKINQNTKEVTEVDIDKHLCQPIEMSIKTPIYKMKKYSTEQQISSMSQIDSIYELDEKGEPIQEGETVELQIVERNEDGQARYRDISMLSDYNNQQDGLISLLYEIKERGNRIKLIICVSATDEGNDKLDLTMKGIQNNMKHFQKQGIQPNEILVIVIFDGIDKINNNLDQKSENVFYHTFTPYDLYYQINEKKSMEYQLQKYQEAFLWSELTMEKFNNNQELLDKFKSEIANDQTDINQTLLEEFEENLQNVLEKNKIKASDCQELIQKFIEEFKEQVQKKKVDTNYSEFTKILKTNILIKCLKSLKKKPELLEILKQTLTLCQKNSDQRQYSSQEDYINQKKKIFIQNLREEGQKYIQERKNTAWVYQERILIQSSEQQRELGADLDYDIGDSSTDEENELGSFQIVQSQQEQTENKQNNESLYSNQNTNKSSKNIQLKDQKQNKNGVKESILNDLKGNYLNVMYVSKFRNAKKLDSHLWFFKGFCNILEPYYTVLIDIGLEPKDDAIYRFFECMELNKNCGGVCGFMGLRPERIIDDEGKRLDQLDYRVDFISRMFHQFFNIQKAQSFEFDIDHIVDKAFQSLFGYVHILPSTFCAYRYDAIKDVLNVYLKTELNPSYIYHSLQEANMYLKEDRILSMELYCSKSYIMQYVPESVGYVDPIINLVSLMGQRKKWYISFALYIYFLCVGGMVYFSLNYKHNSKQAYGIWYAFSTMFGIFMLISFGFFIHQAINSLFFYDLNEIQSFDQDEKYLFKLMLLGALIGGFAPVFLDSLFKIRSGGFFEKYFNLAYNVVSFAFYLPSYIQMFQIFSFCNIDDFTWESQLSNLNDVQTKIQKAKINQRIEDFAEQKFYFVSKWFISNIVVGCTLGYLSKDQESRKLMIFFLAIYVFIFVILKCVGASLFYLLQTKLKLLQQLILTHLIYRQCWRLIVNYLSGKPSLIQKFYLEDALQLNRILSQITEKMYMDRSQPNSLINHEIALQQILQKQRQEELDKKQILQFQLRQRNKKKTLLSEHSIYSKSRNGSKNNSYLGNKISAQIINIKSEPKSQYRNQSLYDIKQDQYINEFKSSPDLDKYINKSDIFKKLYNEEDKIKNQYNQKAQQQIDQIKINNEKEINDNIKVKNSSNISNLKTNVTESNQINSNNHLSGGGNKSSFGRNSSFFPDFRKDSGGQQISDIIFQKHSNQYSSQDSEKLSQFCKQNQIPKDQKNKENAQIKSKILEKSEEKSGQNSELNTSYSQDSDCRIQNSNKSNSKSNSRFITQKSLNSQQSLISQTKNSSNQVISKTTPRKKPEQKMCSRHSGMISEDQFNNFNYNRAKSFQSLDSGQETNQRDSARHILIQNNENVSQYNSPRDDTNAGQNKSQLSQKQNIKIATKQKRTYRRAKSSFNLISDVNLDEKNNSANKKNNDQINFDDLENLGTSESVKEDEENLNQIQNDKQQYRKSKFFQE